MPLALLLLAAAAPSLRDRLIGSWRLEDRVTTFRADGSGSSAGGAFRWSIEGARLELVFGDGSTQLANIELKRDELVAVDVVDADTLRYRRVAPPSRAELVGDWYEPTDAGAARRTYHQSGRATLADGAEARWSLDGDVLVVTRRDGATTRAQVRRTLGELIETDQQTAAVTRLRARWP